MIIRTGIILILSLNTLIAEDKVYESLNKAAKDALSGSKDNYNAKLQTLLLRVGKLTEADREIYYNRIAKKIMNGKQGPFLNQAEFCLIGVILSKATSRELCEKILSDTPPQSVGFVTLFDYLKTAPSDLVTESLKKEVMEKQRPSKNR